MTLPFARHHAPEGDSPSRILGIPARHKVTGLPRKARRWPPSRAPEVGRRGRASSRPARLPAPAIAVPTAQIAPARAPFHRDGCGWDELATAAPHRPQPAPRGRSHAANAPSRGARRPSGVQIGRARHRLHRRATDVQRMPNLPELPPARADDRRGARQQSARVARSATGDNGETLPRCPVAIGRARAAGRHRCAHRSTATAEGWAKGEGSASPSRRYSTAP